jgi:hypothetical protein
MWHNGARPLLLGALLFLCAVILLLAASLYAVTQSVNKPPANPLTSPSPEQILDKKASYKPGDVIVVLGSKCNMSKKPIRITGQSYWESLDTGGPDSATGGNTVSGRDVPPGCLPLQFPHTIPTLGAGRWAIAGRDCVLGTNLCSEWFSDSFVLVIP